MELLPWDYVSLKDLVEEYSRGNPYNLKRITAYIDFWYTDLHFINLEGIRYYIYDGQAVHAVQDALILAEMEGPVCH